MFLKLAEMSVHPQIHLFATPSNHRVKRYLARTEITRRYRCFSGRLKQMAVNIHVSPSSDGIMLRVINHLRTYKGFTVGNTVMDMGTSLPMSSSTTSVKRCFREILHGCPHPLPLSGKVLQETLMDRLTMYSRLHTLSFYVQP